MADDEKTDAPRLPYFDLGDPNVQTVYSNRAIAVIGDSDISLYFGVDEQRPDREVGKLSTRVVMGHVKFMQLVEYLVARYDVLSTMYQGSPPSIDSISASNPDLAAQAWKKLVPVINQTTQDTETPGPSEGGGKDGSS